MNILVIGGTGNVGSQVVRELLKRDVNVRVLTRSEEKTKNLPEGVTPVVGNILEPAVVKSVFKDIDRVFLINTVGHTETAEGLFAINGARLAGVERIVYVSVHELDKWIHLPHFGAKLPVEQAIKDSGISHTIIRPNNFYQNDFFFKDAILQFGIYPQPLGDKGSSRVDIADIAEAAAIALTEDGHNGKTYNLVGPDILNGEKIAEIWSEALGKSIKYIGNDLEAWEQQFLQYMPDWLVFDFKLMYECFQKDGFASTKEDIEIQTKLLGHPPRSFKDFARKTAEIWKSRG